MRLVLTIFLAVNMIMINGISYGSDDAKSTGMTEKGDKSAEWIRETILGHTEYEKKNYDAAIAHYLKGLEYPSSPLMEKFWLQIMIARCYYHRGEVQKALDYLNSLEKQYSSCTAIDDETSGSARTIMLGRIYDEKPRMFRSLNQYDSELAALRKARDYEMARIDESKKFSERGRELDRVGSENGYDINIADCLERLGRTGEAVSRYQQVLKRYEKYHTLEGSNPRYRSQYEPYMINVYINKKIGDCLRDKSYYKKALEKYPDTSITELNELKIMVGDRFIEKSMLKKLATKQGE